MWPNSLIFIVGGAFLLGKATWESHRSLEHAAEGDQNATQQQGQSKALGTQLALILGQVIFSIWYFRSTRS